MRRAPMLSDQELFDVLSQIDQDSAFAADKHAPATQQQHEPFTDDAVAAMTMAAALPVADSWSTVEMLEASVFGSEHDSSDDVFAGFLDTLSHSDECESITSSPQDAKKKTTTTSAAHNGTAHNATNASTADTKPTRKRRKHELDHLRGLASALEAKLASIKQATDANAAPGSSTAHFWKRISDQLLVTKQRAVGENARLRDVLRDQIKVVKSLQRSLAKSPDLNKLGLFPSDRSIARHNAATATHATTSTLKAIYNSMFQRIATSYNGIDSIFAQANMPRPTTHESRKVNMELQSHDGVHVMCMQVVETRLLPFSFLFIGDAAWTYLTSTQQEEERRMGFHREFIPDGDDELYGECKLNCSTGVVKLAGHVAMRRYQEKHRLTFVWECVGTCQSDPYATKVVEMSEKGWCLFEPSEDDPLNATVFQTCVHFTPTPVNEPHVMTASPIDVGVTTELVLGVYEKTVGHIFNAVLSSLLQGLQANE